MSLRSQTSRSTHARRFGPAGTFAMATGVVFLLVGVLGCLPVVTTDFDKLHLAGHESGAELLGIFQVSVLHNVVHLLFGLVGIAAARQARSAIAYLIGGGAVYFGLWIYGLVIDRNEAENFVPVNDADNWLHLVLAVAMVAMGFVARRAHRG